MTALVVEPCALTGTMEQFSKIWCVYEHWMTLAPGHPPDRMYIGACLLRDVWSAPDAKRNTDWINIVKADTLIMVRIVSVGTITEALNQRAALVASSSPPPRCNVIGRDISSMQRTIHCSNGQTYRTQQEAAETLGLSQSVISKILAGKAHYKSTKGYRFWYGEQG